MAANYSALMNKIQSLIDGRQGVNTKKLTETINKLKGTDPYGSSALEKQMASGYMDLEDQSYSQNLPLYQMQLEVMKSQADEDSKAETEKQQKEYQTLMMDMLRHPENYNRGGSGAGGGGAIMNPEAIASGGIKHLLYKWFVEQPKFVIKSGGSKKDAMKRLLEAYNGIDEFKESEKENEYAKSIFNKLYDNYDLPDDIWTEPFINGKSIR